MGKKKESRIYDTLLSLEENGKEGRVLRETRKRGGERRGGDKIFLISLVKERRFPNPNEGKRKREESSIVGEPGEGKEGPGFHGAYLPFAKKKERGGEPEYGK